MNRRVIAVVIAVVLALAGTAAVSAYVRGADARAVAGQQVVQVYIADELVSAGTTLKDAVDSGLLQQQSVAAKGAPEGVLTSETVASESDSVAVSDIQPGEIVLTARFGSQTAVTSDLAIPTGKMAVSIALTDPAHVGSFVKPGSKIAVFDTFNVRGVVGGAPVPAGNHLQDDAKTIRATRLLLSGVEVLAVGATSASASTDQAQSQSQTTGNQTPQSTTLYTLAVDQTQAQQLVQGIQTGTLYLALVTDGSSVTPGAGVNDLTLFTAK